MVHHLGVGYKFRKPFTDCYRPWAKHKIIQYTPLASLSYFPTGCFDRFDADWNVWKSLVVSSDVQSVIADWNPYMATDHDLVPWLSNGSRIVLFCFFRCFFLGSVVLSVFLAICSIFELEAAISTVLQHFGVRTSHLPWYLQHFGAQTFHVGWYFATRVHLGFV